MHGGPMRILEASGDPQSVGRLHGATYREEIGAYLADRISLAGEQAWSGYALTNERILELAGETLLHHQQYAPDLYEEMLSMADAAGISASEAVVVGGFTDLVDIVRAHGAAPVMPECTLILDPGAGVYAQTWDMHASAGEFVLMLRVESGDAPAAWVQTTTGCLGQIGMNEAGIGVGINNLTSLGRPGVTWPFVVRKVLQQTDLDDAVKCVLDAPLGGGHNFAIIGPEGQGANIEAMPGYQHVENVSESRFVHANHCLDPGARREEGFREQVYVEDSDARLRIASELAGDLKAFFDNPRISKRTKEPHLTATCGAVIMRPRQGEMDVVWGVPGERPWETLRF